MTCEIYDFCNKASQYCRSERKWDCQTYKNFRSWLRTMIETYSNNEDDF